MKLKMFDGQDIISLTRKDLSELDQEVISDLYFNNEVFRYELARRPDLSDRAEATLEEISQSTVELLDSLIAAVGEPAALAFAARASLAIILVNEEE